MQKTTFDGYLRASANQAHPLQTNLDFIFTDFHPNKNRQGVPVSEASNIMTTGLNQPVKVNFTGGKVRGHSSAVPVGPIISMEQQGDKIIGRAIIWKDEYPDLTAYLEEASKDTEGVQFSWELYYQSAEADNSGVNWLQGCIVAATTIVADPAYAGRTHLLALAEEEKMDKEELQKQISELHDKLWGMLDVLYAAMSLPGAIDKAAGIETQFAAVVEAAKGLAEAKAELETKIQTAEQKTVELETSVAELKQYKEVAEAEKAKAEILDARRGALKDVLPIEEFNSKAEFFAGLNDEQFKVYTESLTKVAQSAKATAGVVSGLVPDPITNSHQNDNNPTRSDLAKALRTLNK